MGFQRLGEFPQPRVGETHKRGGPTIPRLHARSCPHWSLAHQSAVLETMGGMG